MRRVESLRLAAERYAQPAVALLLHGPNGFEQRADAAPFHIAAGRPVEDLLDRVAVLGVQMRAHRFDFTLVQPVSGAPCRPPSRS
jgi:hypothetical protein